MAVVSVVLVNYDKSPIADEVPFIRVDEHTLKAQIIAVSQWTKKQFKEQIKKQLVYANKYHDPETQVNKLISIADNMRHFI